MHQLDKAWPSGEEQLPLLNVATRPVATDLTKKAHTPQIQISATTQMGQQACNSKLGPLTVNQVSTTELAQSTFRNIEQ